MEEFTRFDLEDAITKTWCLNDTLEMIYQFTDKDLSDVKNLNELQNLLLGMHSLYELHFQKLQHVFEHLVNTNKIQ